MNNMIFQKTLRFILAGLVLMSISSVAIATPKKLAKAIDYVSKS